MGSLFEVWRGGLPETWSTTYMKEEDRIVSGQHHDVSRVHNLINYLRTVKLVLVSAASSFIGY